MSLKGAKKVGLRMLIFNPYKNGISSYDMAFLSSKSGLKNKTVHLKSNSQKDYLAA